MPSGCNYVFNVPLLENRNSSERRKEVLSNNEILNK
jgi:hypothetical protein